MSTPFAPDWVEQPSDCFEFRMFLEFPVFARAGMQFESHLGHSVSAGQGLFVCLLLTKLDFALEMAVAGGAGPRSWAALHDGPCTRHGEGTVAAPTRAILKLNEELSEQDGMIAKKVTVHQHAQVLLSMPGFGPVLAAEFLGATGGDPPSFNPPTGSLASSDWSQHRGTQKDQRQSPSAPRLQPTAPQRLQPLRRRGLRLHVC
jgi:hypothetical protein